MPNNNEQIKAQAIKTIRIIFCNILEDLRKHPDPTNQTLYEHQLFNLELYREALIHEVNTRDVTCDHPMRAAFALEKLHKSTVYDFQDNLNNFKNQSQDSGFYPTTRKVAHTLAQSIVLAGSIALTVLVSGWFALLAVPTFFVWFNNIPKICKDYQDVYDAKEKSKVVCNFYSMFRRNANPPAYDNSNIPPQVYQPYVPVAQRK